MKRMVFYRGMLAHYRNKTTVRCLSEPPFENVGYSAGADTIFIDSIKAAVKAGYEVVLTTGHENTEYGDRYPLHPETIALYESAIAEAQAEMAAGVARAQAETPLPEFRLTHG